MLNRDKDALICDLAETYNIYDYRSLPMTLVATFSVGLGENSRIKRSFSGVDYSIDQLILGALLDRFTAFIWSESGKKPPEIVPYLLGDKNKEKNVNLKTFKDATAFEEEWKRIIQGETNGK